MKKLCFLTVSVIVMLLANAQQDTMKHKRPVQPVPDGRYCVTLEAGKPQMTMNGKPLKAEVELKNGSRITPEGTVVRKDGTIQMIKPGSCVNTDGNEVEHADSRK
jgi:hypothetical protein